MFFPIQCFTHYSITEAFAKPDELAKKAHELKLPGIAITDIHSVSGCVEFVQEIEKLNKKSDHKVKPVLGATLNIYGENQIIVLSKNLEGWKSLIKLISLSEKDKEGSFITKENFNSVPLNNLIIIDPKTTKYKFRPVYYTHTKDLILQQILICIKMKTTINEAKEKLKDHEYFKFFTESCLDYSVVYEEGFESTNELLDQIEFYSIARKPIIPTFNFDKSIYKSSDDMLLQLCRQGWVDRKINAKTKDNPKLREVYANRIKEEINVFIETGLSNYILIIRDMFQFVRKHNQRCGLRGSAVGCLVSYLIGISNIDPVIPDPTLPYSPARELLFSRFFNSARFNKGEISFDEYSYKEFLKNWSGEVNSSIESEILGDYLEIINDELFNEEISFLKKQKGGLEYLDYILKNVQVNPINSINSHILYAYKKVKKINKDVPVTKKGESYSLMDIDFDIPISFRPKLIHYLESIYGKECLAQIITFGRMDGKGAIKEVFRMIQGQANSLAIANDITKKMIDTAKVQDILEEEREENPKYSVIDYCIENIPEIKTASEEYAYEFGLAKELTNTIRSAGIHAAGIVIADKPLDELFPLGYSKDGTRLVTLEMSDLETVGGCKYDLLSVAAYEKMGVIEKMLNEGLDEVPIPELSEEYNASE